MHIHASQMSFNAVNPYAAAADKAIAAQRAGEVRKKLLKGAAEIDGAPIPAEALLVDRWMSSGGGQTQGENHSQIGVSGRDPELG
ncbi:MAG: hypothetical protein ABSG51_00380 [Terracidiphilus sp.]|jgi:hypothetical protein